MNGPGRGDAKRDAVLFGHGIAAHQIAPDLARGRIEIGARGAQVRLGAPDQALHGVVVAHRLQSLRGLAARKLDRGIERGAGDADRGRGKAHAEHHVGGELVERSCFAQGRGIVAQRGEFFRDEQILDRIGVGAGAPEADHVPDVVQGGIRHRKQDGADFRRAVGLEPRRAVGLDDPDMGAEPARLPHAAGEIPARAGAVAAGHRLHLMRDRAPGEDAGRRIEDLVRRLGIEIGRGHRADASTGRGTTRWRRRPLRPPPASA